MRIKMKDIAAMAGVSPSAVSLILNGNADKRIAKEKQELVLELVKKHNYRSNMLARNLRAKQSNTVGVWMPYPVNQGYTEVMIALQRELRRKGYTPLFAFFGGENITSDKLEAEMIETLNTICAHDVCGLITLHNHERLKQLNIPIVTWNQSEYFSGVEYDHRSAVRRAVEYLKDLGHEKFGFVGLPDDPYCISLQEILPEVPVFECQASLLAPVNNVIPLWFAAERRPTVLLIHNDTLAGRIFFDAMRHGVRIPEDLSILSFRSVANAAVPELTGFLNNCAYGVKMLVEMLEKRIANPGCDLENISLEQDFRKGKTCRRLN